MSDCVTPVVPLEHGQRHVTYLGQAFEGKVHGWPASLNPSGQVAVINLHGLPTIILDRTPGDYTDGWPEEHPAVQGVLW